MSLSTEQNPGLMGVYALTGRLLKKRVTNTLRHNNKDSVRCCRHGPLWRMLPESSKGSGEGSSLEQIGKIRAKGLLLKTGQRELVSLGHGGG